MPMSDLNTLLILMLAVGLGWLLGRNEGRQKSKGTPFPSMDMLSSDASSETMQAILNMAQRQEAVELQLNLGVFYRRRGELDKAISIHQSLFARPDLEKSLSAQVQLELASDYLNAGLFDRAERLLLELLKVNSALKTKVLDKLITLYEEEQEWQKILDLAGSVRALKGSKSVAYACCELADEAIERKSWREVSALTAQALKIDRKCVRALLLVAKMAEAEGFPQKVLANLKEALEYEPGLLQLVQPQLKKLFSSRHRPHEFENYLQELWLKSPMPLTLHSYTEHLAEYKSLDEAISQLTYSISQVPTIEGFRLLLNVFIAKGEQLPISYLHILKDILEKLQAGKNEHLCRSCGFEADKHYWRCPSCKQWESFIPNLARPLEAKLNDEPRIKYAK